MQQMCPICQKKLEEQSEDGSTPDSEMDYVCAPSQHSHHYIERRQKGNLLKMKFRLRDASDNNIYCRIHFDDNSAEIWGQNNSNKIIVNHAFHPDFSDTVKLVEKIKTYMAFS